MRSIALVISLLLASLAGVCQRPGLLYLQTDKQVYTNNEFVWFNASLLHSGADPVSQHQVLCLALIPCDTRVPGLHQKFVMGDGFSFGSFKLPDTIAPGEYKLAAYTNRIGNDSLPVAYCTQDLLIHSLNEPDFRAAVTTLDKDLLVTVRDKTSYQPIRDAALEIWCNRINIKGVTDNKGNWRIPVSKLLVDSSALTQIVKVKVRHGGNFVFVQKDISNGEAQRSLQIRFFPEGGQLLQNVPAHIGWKAITDRGEPVTIKAVLYKNKEAIDTISTNEWGMGAFDLQPQAGVKYSVIPVNSPLSSATYPLPAVSAKGIVIRTAKAVTGDSLRMQLFSAGYDTVRMVLHNFRSLFLEQTFTVNQSRGVLLLLDSIPRGVTAVTLLDEKDHPIAQRLFFAHYDKKPTVTIRPDQVQYQKRQKVTLSFQLNGGAGVAAVSVIQASRMLPNRPHTIEITGFGSRINDSSWLEHSLLTTDPPKLQNLAPFFSPAITGQVTGRIKKPVEVTILNNQSGFAQLQTDASGKLVLAAQDLLVQQDQKLLISANAKSTTSHKLEIDDPYRRIDKKLAASLDYRAIDAGKYVQYTTAKEFDQARQLATVTVTAKSNRTIFGSTNECGDYVCEYNYLNCPNHAASPYSRPPVKGQMIRLPGTGGGMTMYTGCGAISNERVQQFEGVRIGRDFVPEDFSQKTSNNPEYISTLFWSPALQFDSSGNATCSFYTSDITGRFRIEVNGITNNNLFHATGYIEVK